VGTQPAAAEQATAAILAEYGRLAREGLRGEALAEAKRQTAGQLMLSLESATARMYRLAGFALHGERYLSLDEMVATVEELKEDEVGAVAAEFFDPARQTTVWLGPEDKKGGP
jgi:predicted Zn-dependent peptidase